jgi:hypothetical protein
VRARSAFGFALAAACLAGSAYADGRDHHEVVPPPLLPRSVVMPVEYSDAVVWIKERKGPVYRMSGGVAPGLLLGRFSLHVPLEYYYRNPGGDVGLGLRGTYSVCTPVGGLLPLGVIAQGSYLFHYHALHWEAGPMIGLGTLLQAAVAYGSDTDRKLHSIAIRIGYNVFAGGDPVAAITHFSPEAPLPDLGD